MKLKSTPLYALPLLTVITYVLSYLYLAWYHGKWSIFDTIVHEGGTYTLLENTFYASHSLGHIPVHTVIAFLFAGSYLSFSPPKESHSSTGQILAPAVALILFLACLAALSLGLFGREDTLAFFLQRKQTVTLYVRGGSWNLHLASTTMLFSLTPLNVIAARILFARPIARNGGGFLYLLIGIILFCLFTLIFNQGGFSSPITLAWRDARYLAHSVRELATFPLTYYPLALFLLMREDSSGRSSRWPFKDKRLAAFVAAISALALAGIAYQCYLPLATGIGELAQKPLFAEGGNLGISYLLASHYFEHFLDTIYFALLSLLLYRMAGLGRGAMGNNIDKQGKRLI
jgi:hypothetical protein